MASIAYVTFVNVTESTLALDVLVMPVPEPSSAGVPESSHSSYVGGPIRAELANWLTVRVTALSVSPGLTPENDPKTDSSSAGDVLVRRGPATAPAACGRTGGTARLRAGLAGQGLSAWASAPAVGQFSSPYSFA